MIDYGGAGGGHLIWGGWLKSGRGWVQSRFHDFAYVNISMYKLFSINMPHLVCVCR